MLSNLREHKFGRKTRNSNEDAQSLVPDRTDFTRRVLIVVGFGYAHTKQASALILKGTDQLIQVKAFLCVPGTRRHPRMHRQL
jgi:hypothetical protein